MLAAALLFNLGQGVLRPSLPLYLQHVFGANYRMVTLIPVVFGAGKWAASLPTGYLLDRLGRRRLMVTGLVVTALSDVASVMTAAYGLFLGARAVAGAGWAMFATVATTTMVDRSRAGRGRAISLLLMSETLGLLLGSLAGGWLYRGAGTASPFLFEAACMVVAAVVVARWPTASRPPPPPGPDDRRLLRQVVWTPGVLLASGTNAVLMGIQTGIVVFLVPLYLVERGRLGPEAVGYMVALGVLGRLSGLWLAGGLSGTGERLRALGLGLLVYAVVLGSLTFVTDAVLLGLWSVLLGGAAGFVAGLPTAIVGDRVAEPLHGIAIGWLRTVTDVGMLLGPLVTGALADAADLTTPFRGAAVVLGVLAWRCATVRVTDRSEVSG